ncbi:MAG: AraC family transcriptional regulator [Rikenellaceae bacterium]
MEYRINYICSNKELEYNDLNNTHFKLVYILSGTKSIVFNEDKINFCKGELLYIRKHCILSYTNNPENGNYQEIEILYTLEEIHIIINDFLTKFKYHLALKDIPLGYNESIISQHADCNLTNYFDNLLLLIKDNFVGNNLQVDWIKRSEFIFLLVSSKLSYLSTNMLYDIKTPKKNFVKIVNENIFSKINISELSEKCGMSESSFKKEFATYFKQSPHKWFIDQRLNKAKFLLISTDKDIQETAAECCFDNTSHFIKLFKKKFKLTPLKYRNKLGDEGL